jgi:hypothetical protein
MQQPPPIQGAGGPARDLGTEAPPVTRKEPSTPSQEPHSQRGSGAAQELRSDAQHVGSTVKDRIHSTVDNRKGDAVGQTRSAANAIHRVAGEMDEGAPAWLKSAFQQGADQLQRFSETLEQKDSRQLMSDVQNFARERPALFLGGCAAAGFAFARVFKAGGEQPQQSRQFDEGQPFGDGAQDFGRGDTGNRQTDEDPRAGESRPFMAQPETAPPSSRLNRMEDDPLTLGSGGDGGIRIPSEGDYR